MATTTVERHIAADPVSTALLLTDAGALEMWPGLVVGPHPAATVPAVITSGRAHEDDVVVAALPPRRTPTAFVADFRVTGGSYGTTDGALTLAYAAGGTAATLVLDGPRDDLAGPARRFLGELARVAESRSSAA